MKFKFNFYLIHSTFASHPLGECKPLSIFYLKWWFFFSSGGNNCSLHTYISGPAIHLLSVPMYDNKKVKFMPSTYCLSLNYSPFFQQKKILHLSWLMGLFSAYTPLQNEFDKIILKFLNQLVFVTSGVFAEINRTTDCLR